MDVMLPGRSHENQRCHDQDKRDQAPHRTCAFGSAAEGERSLGRAFLQRNWRRLRPQFHRRLTSRANPMRNAGMLEAESSSSVSMRTILETRTAISTSDVCSTPVSSTQNRGFLGSAHAGRSSHSSAKIAGRRCEPIVRRQSGCAGATGRSTIVANQRVLLRVIP